MDVLFFWLWFDPTDAFRLSYHDVAPPRFGPLKSQSLGLVRPSTPLMSVITYDFAVGEENGFSATALEAILRQLFVSIVICHEFVPSKETTAQRGLSPALRTKRKTKVRALFRCRPLQGAPGRCRGGLN